MMAFRSSVDGGGAAGAAGADGLAGLAAGTGWAPASWMVKLVAGWPVPPSRMRGAGRGPLAVGSSTNSTATKRAAPIAMRAYFSMR